MPMRILRTLFLCGSALLVHGCSQQSEPQVLREIPWALVTKPLIMDAHSHTRFSDGSLEVSQLVEKAVTAGCDVLAITDHGDLSERAATPAYFQAIRTTRKQHPELILFAGLERNIPRMTVGNT